MIQLSFELPSPGEPWGDSWGEFGQRDPANIGELDLCYKYFGVRVRFAVDEVEVVSDRRYVTLVDFALSLQHALGRISAEEDAAVGFTESDEVIRFRIEEGLVAITSSKREWKVLVERSALVAAFEKFVRQAHSRLVERVPKLAENPVVRGLLK